MALLNIRSFSVFQMKFDGVQLRDNETIDNSKTKKEFFEMYHQQKAKINDSNQNIEFRFGEKNKYHQIANAYLQCEMTIEKDVAKAVNRNLVDRDTIRLLIETFSNCFKEARLSTTGG